MKFTLSLATIKSNTPNTVKAIPIAGPFTNATNGLEKFINAFKKFL